MTNVAISYYSMYGHVAKLASSLNAGVTSVPGVKAGVYQVPETLNEDVLKALHAPPGHDLTIAHAGRAQGRRSQGSALATEARPDYCHAGRAPGRRWHSAGLPHALRHAAGAGQRALGRLSGSLGWMRRLLQL
ncbi:hypothetical protein PR003_g28464 [Phytophthora rubi]|uniref:Flavodoxin-like domain-containing protein n=1 Tax=Phytophthora rubi TaxID=129364 RepID=A0A6A3IK02_9STRA|nr:hypothetical protein PR001_g23732 [Phytophthora rubi]KAE9278647.1 hypothetical protein PR003_g28464 [Phytophthora rubi]